VIVPRSKEFFRKRQDHTFQGGTAQFSTAKKEFNERDLEITVCMWGLDDVLVRFMYSKQITKIPDTFKTTDDYYRAFYRHVVEEARCELEQGILQSPSLVTARLTKLERDADEPRRCTVRFDFDPKSAATLAAYNRENPTLLHAGAVWVFVDASLNPFQVTSQVANGPHFFGVIRGGGGDENGTDGKEEKKVTAYIPPDSPESALIGQEVRAAPLCSITTCKRICKSIDRAIKPKCATILLGNDHRIERVDPKELNNHEALEKVKKRCTMLKLNESQTNAITECARVQKGVVLIHGPPGTGKTSTVSAFLYILYKMSKTKRVLVTAPTNVAIANLATHLLNRIDRRGGTGDGLSYFTLISNEQRMQITSNLARIHVPSRVDRVWKTIAATFQIFEGIDYLCREGPPNHPHETEWQSEREAVEVVFKGVQLRLTSLAETGLAAVLKQDVPAEFKQFKRDPAVKILEEVEGQLKDAVKALETVIDSTAQRFYPSRAKAALEKVRMLCQKGKNVSNIGALLMMGRETFQQEIIASSRFVFSTIATAGSFDLYGDQKFQTVVVDEAAQAVEALTLITLRKETACIVLAGDPQQLPATVISPYRMHPRISAFPSQTFYEGRLKDSIQVKEAAVVGQPWHADGLYPPLMFMDVGCGKESRSETGSSLNEVEALLVTHLVKRFIKLYGKDSPDVKIGIVTPYSAQAAIISRSLNLRTSNQEEGNNGMTKFTVNDDETPMVEVKTVDGFQGGEKDIIIFSTVRSNASSAIGFLDDYRRLNVALTRAKHTLVIVGSAETLKSDDVWFKLISHCRQNGALKRLDELGDLKARLDRKITYTRVQRFVETERRRLQSGHVKFQMMDLMEHARWKIIFAEEFHKAMIGLSEAALKKILEKVLRIADGRRQSWTTQRKEVRVKGGLQRDTLQVYVADEWRILWSVWLTTLKGCLTVNCNTHNTHTHTTHSTHTHTSHAHNTQTQRTHNTHLNTHTHNTFNTDTHITRTQHTHTQHTPKHTTHRQTDTHIVRTSPYKRR